jgi:putative ABC transport system permease protein
MLHDIGMACRALWRRPAFTALAAGTFAVGAAANAVVLAVAYGVLLKPLPFHEPDGLVAIWPGRFLSLADLQFLRERTSGMSDVAAVSPGWTMAMTGAEEPTRVTATRVSANLFTMLGVEPLAGRTFRNGDGQRGAPRVAVVSHRLWLRVFGADARVLGRRVRLDGDSVEIVGVMPAEFELFGRTADLWTPFLMEPGTWQYRGTTSLLVGRLRPAVAVPEADRDFRALMPEMRRQFGYPDDFGRTARLEGLHAALVGDVRMALVALAGATALILLIGGANVGTLLLIRAAGRARALAVQAALGASPARIARTLLAESALLAIAGGAGGLGVGWLALPIVVAALPADLPRIAEIALDVPLSLAVVLVAIATALLCGGAAALGSTRLRMPVLLRTGVSGESREARRARRALVSAEIALALVLSIGAGLLLQTLWRLERVETGFDAAPLLTLRLQPAAWRGQFSTAVYYESLLERVRNVPGVVQAGAIQHLPFSGYNWNGTVDVEGLAVADDAARPHAGFRIATDGYFAAIGQRLLEGRTFEQADAARHVVIVNETFARRHWGSLQAAIGRRLRIRTIGRQGNRLTVVGVVADVRHVGLGEPALPEIYTPPTHTSIPAMMLAVRASGDPLALAPAVRDAIRSIDPHVPIADVQGMTAMISQSLGRPRVLMRLVAGLAVSGLLLAALGVYGVVAYSVAQRRREIGIRMALGAERARVLRLVLREGLWYAIAGLAAGMPAAFLSARALRGLLFGVAPTDTTTFALVATFVVLVVLGAAYLPARRAARLAPVEALAQD